MKSLYSKLIIAFCGVLSLTACLKEDANPAEGTLSPYISLDDVIRIYRNQDVTLNTGVMNGASKVTGIVISDAAAQNLPKGTMVIQNRKRGLIRGLILNFGESTDIPFVVGDSVVVDVTGSTLTRTKGSLNIKNLTLSQVEKVSEGNIPVVQQTSLANLANNFDKFEGTLVKIVGANITPTPVSGETYAGSKNMDDGSNGDVKLFTEANAPLAARRVPANATFTGIAVYYNENGDDITGAVKQIRMRSAADAENASGPLYPGYPEDFEQPEASQKASYNMTAIQNNINLRTGNWKLQYAILGALAGSDRFNPAGKQCVRFQNDISNPAYTQMNFDLPNGASKVTVSYGSYGTNPGSTWRLEYSQNGGVTWTQFGTDIKDASPTLKTATFLMDFSGPIRFRVHKLGLGTSNNTTIFNGRMNIDDFAVYQN